MITDS